jgi:hypothetical protein
MQLLAGCKERVCLFRFESSDAFGVHGNTSLVACVISIPLSNPHPLGFYPPETGQCVVVPGGRFSAVGQNHFFALAGFLATAFALTGAFALAFTVAFAGALATAFAAAFAGFAGTFFAVAIRTSSFK